MFFELAFMKGAVLAAPFFNGEIEMDESGITTNQS
jgi:hypothetical protein